MNFVNKVVIVTGASSGIGAATAIEYSKKGADVVIVGRNETKLAKVAGQVAEHGKPPLVIKADVSKPEDTKRIIDNTIAKYGKLDILVNNAGTARVTSVMADNIMEVFDEMMNTNLRSVVLLTYLAAPHLIKTKGNIVNVSSVFGKKTFEGLSAYMTSKAALDHYSRGAALEFAKVGVRVNVVSPGPVITDIMQKLEGDFNIPQFAEQLPLKRASKPEEIAAVVLFLSSDLAIGITGSDYIADNGVLIN